MKKAKSIYIDFPIRIKILVWFIPVLLITVSIIGGYSYYTAKNQVLKKTNLAQMEITKQISHQLDYISNSAIDFSNYLFLLTSVQQYLNPLLQDDTISRRGQISDIVSSLIVNNRDMQSLILYGFNEEIPTLAINKTGVTGTMPFEQFKKTAYYKMALEQKGRPAWALLKGGEALFEGDKQTQIILTKVIKNSNTLNDFGILVIGISEKNLRDQYTKGLNDDAQIFILNENDVIMTSTNTEWIGQTINDIPVLQERSHQSNPIHLASNEWLLSQSDSDLGWKVLLLQPRKELLKELQTIKGLTFVVALICFILSVWISWHISLFITKPLKKLTTSMQQLQKGDFSQRVEFHGKDEIGALGRGYDLMVQQTNQLIDDVYRSSLRQKEAELKSLQAQIHPHFLYNTLDTIFWMAQKKEDKEIANIIYSLSQFFRLSLNDGRDFVTVNNELLLVKNYLNIQKKRFPNKFTFEINANVNMMDYLIPKLLIQPLVENSIIHGIESIEENGHIYIHTFRQNNNLVIHVTDNGCGIPPDKLKTIKTYMQEMKLENNILNDEKNHFGYALVNIIERLKISYGNAATIDIDSIEDFGTKIIVTLPLQKELNK